MKRRKEAELGRTRTTKQLPDDRTHESIAGEVVEGLSSLLKRVEGVENFIENLEDQTKTAYEKIMEKLNGFYIDDNTPNPVANDSPEERQPLPRIPERIDIVVDVIVEFRLGGLRFSRGGRRE